MPKAVIVGGTGQIGHALARRLLEKSWDVTIASRHNASIPDGCRHVEVHSRDTERLGVLIGRDTDLLLSCVAFDADDAACLTQAGRAAGRIVVISSASVYRDEQGRTLGEAPDRGFPVFPVPLDERSPTVAPGPETYSTRKIAMENMLLRNAPCPVTILRPCAIHGPESKHAREWWFVKRLLDGRTVIPLAYGGQSRFQTTSVTAITDAVFQAWAGDLPAITNVSDADSPTVAEIGYAIMDIMSLHADLVGLPAAPSYPPEFGATPWSIPRPMIISAAARAGATYAQSAGAAVRWLIENATSDSWHKLLPQLAAYPYEHFDYTADDRALRWREKESAFRIHRH